MSVRDAFYDVLRTHGITTIFGNPGSNELPLLKQVPDDFRYVLALQEGVAVGIADGFAQASGVPSVVNLHAAAGTGNAMGNLTNTQSGHVPVVVTSGQQSRRYSALNALLTNVDAPQLARPLVKWSTEPLRASDVPLALSKGILLASAAPAGPVYVSIPLDDWDHPADPATTRLLTRRGLHGAPVAADPPLRQLAGRLEAAGNPVLVLGPDVDDPVGWAGAVRLADRLRLPVWVAPSPSRCPFPTRHPAFQGLLPAGVGTVADRLAGHDLVAVFGAAVFRYHETVDGEYLAAGADLWSVTSDPDEAARAPMGHAVIGDPSDALTRVAGLVPSRAVAGPPTVDHAPPAAADGPPFAAEAILDAVNAAKDDATVIVLEWTSADMIWDRLDLTRPGSLYFPASGGLGWGLPAAIGIQLADPARRVIALIGDGALQYTVSGLWTAAQHRIPVVFVVPRNDEYAALKQFTELMDAPDTPGLELPALDVVGLATAYGVPAVRADTLDAFTTELRRALAATDGPRLIEIPQRRFAGDQP
ncbi:benzoylformate decarboxylase [Dactylosporangium sp. NPDC049525]|uniref:benzoylformate decarboxylase n=1 Tax=Dactylosporangium sp. NPDC049525 TaxID=3154730 RepID=UPI0034467522